MSIFPIITFLLSAILLSGCTVAPSPGERIVMVITKIPTKRQQLERHPGLSLALRRGISRDDVSSDRLVIAGCYLEHEKIGNWINSRHGYVLLPKSVSLEKGDVIEITAEDADEAYIRFFGRYIRKVAVGETDYLAHKYSVSDKELRCGEVSSDGRMQVEVYGTAAFWDYDLAAAEASRNLLISDEELHRGRIAIGECSPGVDSWAIWKVRIPEGMDLKEGDYIEATAGAHEAPRSLGSLSKAIRKVAEPPKEDFIMTQGRYTVDCAARAEPLRRE